VRRKARLAALIGLLGLLLPAAAAPAGLGGHLEIIDPFIGDASESYEGFPFGGSANLPVFGGAGVMSLAFITSGSTFMGSTISAHSAGWSAP
jgi:hypothetical protein